MAESRGQVTLYASFHDKAGYLEVFELGGPIEVTVGSADPNVAYDEAMKTHQLMLDSAEKFKQSVIADFSEVNRGS